MSDPVRRSIRTFLQSFVGVFALTLLGFLGDVTRWASLTNHAAFPPLNPLAKGLVAALCAAAATVVTLGQNWAEDKAGKSFLIPKANPDPEPTQPPSEGAVVPALVDGISPSSNGSQPSGPDGFVQPEGGQTGDDLELPKKPLEVAEPLFDRGDLGPADGPMSREIRELIAEGILCGSPYRGEVCILSKGHLDPKHIRRRLTR